MKIAIIGAGIIGTTAAWEFLREGKEVILLEGREEPGLGTSHANAGQLSYDYVAPLADPGVFNDLPKWLFSPSSPLRFRPRLDPHQWSWLLSFLKACNVSTARASTAALLQLSYLSRDTLHAWMQDDPVDFHHRRNGKLIAYRNPRPLEKARAQVEYQASQGSRQRILSRDEAVDLEPALASWGDALAGCIYTPTEEVGDCYLLTRGLFERIPRHPKATVRTNARVVKFQNNGGQAMSAVLDTGETIEADEFVVANGLHAYDLLKRHGERVPLYGLKGYSLSLAIDARRAAGTTTAGNGTAATGTDTAASGTDAPVAPDISVTDYENRIVYARLGNILRIAAMVDMGDYDADIRPARIQHLKRQIVAAFPGLDVENARVWAGNRPATPEGRPIIRRSHKLENVWLNIGHGALGFTLACGSAVLLHALVSGGRLPIDAAPCAKR